MLLAESIYEATRKAQVCLVDSGHLNIIYRNRNSVSTAYFAIGSASPL